MPAGQLRCDADDAAEAAADTMRMRGWLSDLLRSAATSYLLFMMAAALAVLHESASESAIRELAS